jgi:antitoxin component YwqK of YwqJK toxin-antitoxin module
MKINIIIAGLVFIIFSRENKSHYVIIDATDSHLRRSNGILYLNNLPFTGTLQEFFENRKLKSQAFYVNGKEDGITTTWYSDGKKASERVFRKGQKEGEHKGWHQHGNLSFRANFKNGIYEGILEEWHENGQPSRLKHYKHGQEDGLQQAWRENGKLYINCQVVKGRYYGLRGSELCYSVKNKQ